MNKILFILLLSSLSVCSAQKLDKQKETKAINIMMDTWHKAAATANEDVFFGSFTPNGIYIGTDPTEHWTATELKEWSKKYFDKESAWSFVPYNRHIFFSKDGKIAWLDELLKTWMGTCRGSSVLEYQNGEWKIAHYHLAIAVPNDKTEEYLKLFD